jgi:hypothetical protein
MRAERRRCAGVTPLEASNFSDIDGAVAVLGGGCPLMYCDPVDPAHRCFGWWLRLGRAVESG